MLYDIDKKYMCIVKDKKSKKKLSRFLLSKCPCRDFVRVEILSVSRFCLCRDFVCVEILSVSRFCPVEILSCRGFVLSRFCPCRDFVPVEILSVSRFCPCRDFVCRGFVCRGFVLVPRYRMVLCNFKCLGILHVQGELLYEVRRPIFRI